MPILFNILSCINESCHNLEGKAHGLYHTEDFSLYIQTGVIIYQEWFSAGEMPRHKDIYIAFVYSTSQSINKFTNTVLKI